MGQTSYSYRLPWPPSVNCYIRRGNNRSYMTKRGKEFRSNVCHTILNSEMIGQLKGRIAVHIELIPPDKRKRDCDNHIKAVLDALEHAGVYENDSQIDEIRVNRLHVEPPGCCDVTICELTQEPV